MVIQRTATFFSSRIESDEQTGCAPSLAGEVGAKQSLKMVNTGFKVSPSVTPA